MLHIVTQNVLRSQEKVARHMHPTYMQLLWPSVRDVPQPLCANFRQLMKMLLKQANMYIDLK